MKTIKVRTQREYSVYIGDSLLDRAGEYIYDAVGGDIAAIITDDVVSSIYLNRLRASMKNAGFKSVVFTVRNGEGSKNVFTCSRALEFLADNKVTRTDVVVALGGGVVGDIAVFTAATYLQGVPCVLIPTTLLAAVDASVGGKAALNMETGKDLVGVFHQPVLVLTDCRLLEELPPRIFVEGCSEIIKFAMVADSELFNMLANDTSLDLEEVVARCVDIKRIIVCRDEFENGERRLLDFGHTIGHAVEFLSKFMISHGKAVSIGMAVEALAAFRLGMCDQDCYNGLIDTLHKYGLPVRTRFEADELMRAAMTDKKRRGDSLLMVFPRKVGKCILSSVSIAEYEKVIKQRTSAVGEML